MAPWLRLLEDFNGSNLAVVGGPVERSVGNGRLAALKVLAGIKPVGGLPGGGHEFCLEVTGSMKPELAERAFQGKFHRGAPATHGNDFA